MKEWHLGGLMTRHDMAFVIPSPMFLLAFSGVQKGILQALGHLARDAME
jgi:hypothetical protein